MIQRNVHCLLVRQELMPYLAHNEVDYDPVAPAT
jgi:hypothetical protein